MKIKTISAKTTPILRVLLIVTVMAGFVSVPLMSNNKAAAAGSLNVSIEPATGSYQTSSTNALTIYGTTSGANTSGFTFTVTLTNMTIDHFDASGNPFSLDSIASGGAAGSTSVTITVGYSDPAGGSGKQLVGKLYTNASGSAGSATATISAVDAYDASLASMAGTGSGGSYTITAPPPPAAPAAATPAATPAATKTPVTSKVTVPTPTSSQVVGASQPTVVEQPKVDEILTSQAPDAAKPAAKAPAAKKKSHALLYIALGGGTFLLAAAGIFGGKYLLGRKRSRISGVAGQPAGSDLPLAGEPTVFQPSPPADASAPQEPTTFTPNPPSAPDDFLTHEK